MSKRPGRPATVTREAVIEAAVRVAQREGLDRFTMQQLADELGVASMTAYYHVGNRTELVQLVVEHVLGRIEIPDPSSGPWTARLKALESNVRRSLASLGSVPSGLPITDSAATRRLVEAVLEILREAGFDDHVAALAYGALFTYMIGQLDLDRATRHAATPAGDHRFDPLLDQRAPHRHPTPDDIFEFAFDLLLAGLLTWRDAGDGPNA